MALNMLLNLSAIRSGPDQPYGRRMTALARDLNGQLPGADVHLPLKTWIVGNGILDDATVLARSAGNAKALAHRIARQSGSHVTFGDFVKWSHAREVVSAPPPSRERDGE